jgi:hypothetical protein
LLSVLPVRRAREPSPDLPKLKSQRTRLSGVSVRAARSTSSRSIMTGRLRHNWFLGNSADQAARRPRHGCDVCWGYGRGLVPVSLAAPGHHRGQLLAASRYKTLWCTHARRTLLIQAQGPEQFHCRPLPFPDHSANIWSRKHRFAIDSPLEGTGFEPLVPPRKRHPWRGPAADYRRLVRRLVLNDPIQLIGPASPFGNS